MIKSFYTGLTSLRTNQISIDVISNNIANANTNGYKTASVNFVDLFAQSIGQTNVSPFQQQSGLGVGVSGIGLDFSDGATVTSTRSEDFSMQGSSFFVLEDQSGVINYTRDGTFSFDKDGYLVNGRGYKVIQDITAADTGVAAGNPRYICTDDAADIVAQMQIANFDNKNGLERRGGNVYLESVKSGNPQYGRSGNANFGIVNQYSREMSNVDLGLEFTGLIVSSRAYSASAKAITTSDEILQELINIKR